MKKASKAATPARRRGSYFSTITNTGISDYGFSKKTTQSTAIFPDRPRSTHDAQKASDRRELNSYRDHQQIPGMAQETAPYMQESAK